MKRLFGQDSALFRFLQILMNLAIMNVLFLLTSIPVITMGAAYTALLSCVFDLLMEEGEFSAKFYYKNFRKIWKPASAIGTAGFIILVVLGHHAVYFFTSESSVRLIDDLSVFGTCQKGLLGKGNVERQRAFSSGEISCLYFDLAIGGFSPDGFYGICIFSDIHAAGHRVVLDCLPGNGMRLDDEKSSGKDISGTFSKEE